MGYGLSSIVSSYRDQYFTFVNAVMCIHIIRLLYEHLTVSYVSIPNNELVLLPCRERDYENRSFDRNDSYEDPDGSGRDRGRRDRDPDSGVGLQKDSFDDPSERKDDLLDGKHEVKGLHDAEHKDIR